MASPGDDLAHQLAGQECHGGEAHSGVGEHLQGVVRQPQGPDQGVGHPDSVLLGRRHQRAQPLSAALAGALADEIAVESGWTSVTIMCDIAKFCDTSSP